jgi:hypothetical protein
MPLHLFVAGNDAEEIVKVLTADAIGYLRWLRLWNVVFEHQ